MHTKLALRLTAMSGFLAVALGAFGAHGLKPLLTTNSTTANWETAVFYHFTHTLVLLWLVSRPIFAKGSWLCFALGVILFSGSLYLLAVTNLRWLGAITPIGGISLLAGWLWLACKPNSTASASPSQVN